MGEKLKFRPLPDQLIVQEKRGFAVVVAAGAKCKAQIGNKVRWPSLKSLVNSRVVKIDGVRYHIQNDTDMEVMKDEDDIGPSES